MSEDAENEYFSDGVTEELINALTKVPGLRVAARTSSFSFKGKNEDVTEIGRSLRVATVLEGSVRRYGQQVRITAQLVKTADGYHIWSEVYERELADIFAVQEEIARKIVDKLKVELMAGSDSRLVQQRGQPRLSSSTQHSARRTSRRPSPECCSIGTGLQLRVNSSEAWS
jgi:TolB-like protein